MSSRLDSLVLSKCSRNFIDFFQPKWVLPLAIFLVCWCLYLFFMPGHHFSIDGVVMFQYAKTLWFKRSFIMDPPLLWGGEFRISKWPIGLTLVYIPVLAVLSATIFRGNPEISNIPYDPSQPFNPALLENRPYLFSSLVNPFITALAAVLVYMVAMEVGLTRRKACLAALVFGMASPAVAYARYDFAQPLASLLMITAVLCFIRARRQRTLALLVASGVAGGLSILARPEMVIVLGVPFTFLLLLMWPVENEKLKTRLIRMGKPFLLWIAPILLFLALNQWINALRFGGMFAVGYHPSSEFNLTPVHLLISLAGNLFSPGRGMIIFFPLTLLVLPGVWNLSSRDRWLAWTMGSLPLVMLLFYSTWNDWGGGISWGPRFLIPAVPYLAILAVTSLNIKNTFLRILSLVLFIFGWFVTLQGALFNFLGFYSTFSLTAQEVVEGMYHFEVATSPVFSGWTHLFNPDHYDIIWFRRRGTNSYLILMTLLSFGLGLLTAFWGWYFSRDLFRRSRRAPAVTEQKAQDQSLQ